MNSLITGLFVAKTMIDIHRKTKIFKTLSKMVNDIPNYAWKTRKDELEKYEKINNDFVRNLSKNPFPTPKYAYKAFY